MSSVPCFHVSSAYLVTVPSPVGCNPGKLGTIKHVIQCGETVVEMATNKVVSDTVSPLMGKGSKEMSSSYVNREIQVKSKGSEANQLTGASEAAFSSSEMGPTGSRSSNYGNHSHGISHFCCLYSDKGYSCLDRLVI